MRKEYIMSEEDKVLKRQKIEQNRAKKRPILENTKPSKIKKNLDDCNFDDTSMSINSVASTTSDTYFWESDRKYTDLDANRQTVTESLSPVTAASVPSPSSPPENGVISGSKTLDMMKDSSHNSNFENYDHSSSPQEENEVDVEKLRMNSNSPSQNQQRFDKIKPPYNLEKDKKSIISSKKFNQNILDLNSEFTSTNHESMKYSSEFDNTSYNKFDSSPIQNSQYVEHTTHYKRTNIDMNSEIHMEISSEEAVSSQKQNKEIYPKEDNFVSNKFPQESTLIAKLVNNSSFITKIFQNEELLLKIMSDPVVISKLEADPQISQFFKKNGIIADKEVSSEKEMNIHLKDDVKLNHNNSNQNIFKPILKVKQRQIENPILTDLITNSSQEECIKIQRDESSSSEWNRNLSDVTRDVLQDVQRYNQNLHLFKIWKIILKCVIYGLYFRIPIAANSIESILCEAIKLEFSAYSTLGGMETRKILNDAERAKLNELIVANKALLAPLDEDITNLIGEDCKFKVIFIFKMV